MSKFNSPAFPAKWVNDGDLNACSPDGGVVPPGGEAYLTGMSLREYYAGQALIAITGWEDGPSRQTGETYQEAVARVSVEYADALIRALQKNPRP